MLNIIIRKNNSFHQLQIFYNGYPNHFLSREELDKFFSFKSTGEARQFYSEKVEAWMIRTNSSPFDQATENKAYWCLWGGDYTYGYIPVLIKA